MESVMEYAINNGAGLFALLFIALLCWVLKTNDYREKRYLGVIDTLGEQIGSKISCLEQDVRDIKREVTK